MGLAPTRQGDIAVRNRLPIAAWMLLALVLAVASAPVAALGLGQVEVLSRPGEPLVAQIPVISADPRELDQLQARLASPETFRRIGLEPPGGAVSDLQFSVALDARGNPVVRVTSARPIEQPLLTFLLEVDWGQGRLVREYSVLVDAPQSAVAVDQPPVQAPLPAPTTTVVRPPEAVQPVEPEPQVQAEPLPDAPPPASQPEPQPQSVPAEVVAAPPPTAAPEAAAPSGEYGPVQRGQTLSQIASGLGQDGYSLNQRMLALLRENPDAFIDGNINLLREGAVLRMPGRDVLAELSPSEANAVVRAQVRSWRERQAPPAVAADAVADATDGPATDAPRGDRAGATADAPAPVADARLQIVPPAGEGGQAPGSRSGMSAGGEGDMLRNDLRQAREDLATRDAEVEELRTRLAELEELQQKQAQLLDLKDSELAAVQQRLAQSRAADAGTDPTAAAAASGAGAQPAAQPTAQAVEAQPVPERRDADAPVSWPWLLGGLLLVVLAGVAWWWQRRRRVEPAPVAPPARRNYDTAALAAGLTPTGRPAAPASTPPRGAAPTPPPPARPTAGADPVATPATPATAAPAPPGVTATSRTAAAPTAPSATPTATRPAAAPATPPPSPPVDTPVPAPATPVPPPAEPAPTWHAGPLPDAPEGGATAAPASGRDGLELARAYLDLGDNQAARTLLREVLLGRDPNAREEAARMLRELG